MALKYPPFAASARLEAAAQATVLIGPDAAVHMGNYLANTGRTLTIRLENLVKDVPSARRRYEREVSLDLGQRRGHCREGDVRIRVRRRLRVQVLRSLQLGRGA